MSRAGGCPGQKSTTRSTGSDAWLGYPRTPPHHAEGDVATHTRMAAEALASLPAWWALPAPERVRLFAAVLLHDVAKPDSTQHHDDGRITSYGHSRRGDLIARRVLWQLRASVAWREHVAALVRHHQLPFWALERPNLEAIVLRVSLVARNADLALLASADILGVREEPGPHRARTRAGDRPAGAPLGDPRPHRGPHRALDRHRTATIKSSFD